VENGRPVTLRYEIPGAEPVEVDHLVCDVNGTLTDRGELIPGVRGRLERLRLDLQVHLLSADTRGRMAEISGTLRVPAEAISRGDEKRACLERLGAERCVAIGNGLNDAPMLAVARIGFAILGPEGAAAATLAAADVVCESPTVALDLLLDPVALASTLRP
jgi:soluble P-type ATPase